MPKKTNKQTEAKSYNHGEEHPQHPDIGTEPHFKKKKPPVTYRYDSFLSPELNWDENPAREQAEALIEQILAAEDLETAKIAAHQLKAIGEPFLNWTGKAERLFFEVLTLPLFVHERLSTRAIIETLKSHKVEKGEQLNLFELFNDPKWSITDQILRAYEYHDKWVNRMILGDSLVTMNSLLQYEGMGGKVQMIYIDPPYGVKFGSNFQPFVRKRDVKHNDDDDFTREPEMVQAYRDTWELGLHSYLSYLRNRLLLARELLTDSGSVFLQISDENVDHVRELMDEVFGGENEVSTIVWKKGTPNSKTIRNAFNYLLWYSKNINQVKANKLFYQRTGIEGTTEDSKKLALWGEFLNGEIRTLTTEEKRSILTTKDKCKVFRVDKIIESVNDPERRFELEFEGEKFTPKLGYVWRRKKAQIEYLREINRIIKTKEGFGYKFYVDDYPIVEITNFWDDTAGNITDMLYVVQTSTKVAVEPSEDHYKEWRRADTLKIGDIVYFGREQIPCEIKDLESEITTETVYDLEIETVHSFITEVCTVHNCGSGTTAYVAEQWGRRWITCDVSRVPLALARQRLLTATFPWYQLKDNNSPTGGFIYKRKQNSKGEEIGGIVPHITLKSIANNEPPESEILVDRPEVDKSIVRVCSPFTIEGTIPPPVEMEDEPESAAVVIDNSGSYEERMLEILRKSPVLRLSGNRTITLNNVRQPTRTQNLSAEAMVKASDLEGATLGEVVDEALEANLNQLPLSQKPVAFLFGPENGAIAEQPVYRAAGEAYHRKFWV